MMKNKEMRNAKTTNTAQNNNNSNDFVQRVRDYAVIDVMYWV